MMFDGLSHGLTSFVPVEFCPHGYVTHPASRMYSDIARLYSWIKFVLHDGVSVSVSTEMLEKKWRLYVK